MKIRRLVPTDTHGLMTLRREALDLEPLAFAASPADDVALMADSVQRFLDQPEGQVVFGCFDGASLVGMIGLVRGSKVKQRHKATLWGLYVQPQVRSRGVGRSLLDATLEQCRAWAVDQLHLGVSEAAPTAKRLYESVGFRCWGREPWALHWNGQFVDEHHLVLEVKG
jgi:GNAT superfamily N-acetyltransferase